ncbi:CAAX amino protease [Haloferula helveola]|uniref:CAAX amino protease n=2 Tax=Haloferula helveola TaxID=490095 RepID=A0ABM7RDR2_9BACT|nr:CAAX amino protease [Haloferula helveola]
MVVPLLGSLIYFVWFPHGGVGQTAYTATKLFTLVYPFLFLRRIGTKGLRPERGTKGSSVAWGIGSGLAICAAGALLMLSPLGAVVRDSASAVTSRAESLGFIKHYLLFSVFICVFHSGLEEFYWRWFVYGQLREKVKPVLAHVLAAVSFAAHHLVVTLQFFPTGLAVFLALCVAVGGLIWSWMYEKHGGLLGCWVSHLCVDALLMGIGYQLITGG